MNKCSVRTTVVALISAAALMPQAVAAAQYVVDSVLDETDAVPGDGVCRSAGRGCTLRAAVQEANASPDYDTIVIPAGTYVLAIPGAGEDSAATGDLDVTSKITFVGMGAQATVIDGGGLDRILDLRWDTTPYVNPIEISGLTIQGGDAGAGEGGGIRSISGLRLRNVAIHNNRAQTGGGIYIQPSMSIHPLELITTLVQGNSAVQLGGGVYCRLAELTMYRSGVTGNAVTGADGQGGGLYLDSNRAAVSYSTVSGNQSSGDGGGIVALDAIVSLATTTVSGNGTGRNGGGLYSSQSSTSAAANTLNGVTVTANAADMDGDGVGDGGGLYVAMGQVSVENTILAGNSDGSALTQQPDCTGVSLYSAGYNVVGSNSGCTAFVNGVKSDQVGDGTFPLDPRLAALAFNGGAGLTHALLTDSPAMDAANDATIGVFDQRSVLRRADGNNDGLGVSDVGAYEYRTGNQSPLADPGPNQSVNSQDLVVLDGSGSFDPDGTIVSYSWTQISGDFNKPVRLENANTAVATFVAPRVRCPYGGNLVFDLAVTDSAGAVHHGQVSVSVGSVCR